MERRATSLRVQAYVGNMGMTAEAEKYVKVLFIKLKS